MVKRFKQHSNLGKKGQIGTAISWFVATIVVAVILIIFMGISTMKSVSKQISGSSTKIENLNTDTFIRLDQQRSIQMFFKGDYEEKSIRDIFISIDIMKNKEEVSKYKLNYENYLRKKCEREGSIALNNLKPLEKLLETTLNPFPSELDLEFPTKEYIRFVLEIFEASDPIMSAYYANYDIKTPRQRWVVDSDNFFYLLHYIPSNCEALTGGKNNE